jgi:hypothetical protein
MFKSSAVCGLVFGLIGCAGSDDPGPLAIQKPPEQVVVKPTFVFDKVPKTVLLSNVLPEFEIRGENIQVCRLVRTSPKIADGELGFQDFKVEISGGPSVFKVSGRASNTMPADSARIYIVIDCIGKVGGEAIRDSARLNLETPTMCSAPTLVPSTWSLSRDGARGGYVHIICGADTFTVSNRSWYHGTQAGAFLAARMPATNWISPREVTIGIGWNQAEVGSAIQVCVMNPEVGPVPGPGTWCGKFSVGP